MAKKELAKYKRTIFLGIILIALGVTFNTTLEIGSIGTVFIALGGLFFIAGMARKRKEEESLERNEN
jgi:drug/metabolite transporter superfamily protein YnfA